MCLAQGHNTVTRVRLEPAAPWSRVKHSTTEPLCSPLTLLKPMKFAIKFNTVTSGWSIVYIEGLQVMIKKTKLFLKINFVLANSADPDEMHLGLHCLP